MKLTNKQQQIARLFPTTTFSIVEATVTRKAIYHSATPSAEKTTKKILMISDDNTGAWDAAKDTNFRINSSGTVISNQKLKYEILEMTVKGVHEATC